MIEDTEEMTGWATDRNLGKSLRCFGTSCAMCFFFLVLISKGMGTFWLYEWFNLGVGGKVNYDVSWFLCGVLYERLDRNKRKKVCFAREVDIVGFKSNKDKKKVVYH